MMVEFSGGITRPVRTAKCGLPPKSFQISAVASWRGRNIEGSTTPNTLKDSVDKLVAMHKIEKSKTLRNTGGINKSVLSKGRRN